MTIHNAPRYVEMTYTLPFPDDKIRFMAVLTDGTPNQAVENAREEVLRQHPTAIEIEEFMQRKLSDEKAKKILDSIQAGTWEGWDFGRET